MAAVSRRDELRAELDRLAWEQRQAIDDAVWKGRAVDDERLAPLAAEWAGERRRQMKRTCVGILAPIWAVCVAVTLWPLTSNDGGLGAAVVAAISAVGMMLLIVWAGSWPPLVRAEQANLALAGSGVPPRRREPLRRPVTCFVAFLIACVLGLLLPGVGVNLGPLGITGLLLLALACWRSMLPF